MTRKDDAFAGLAAGLPSQASFRPAGTIGEDAPAGPGIYAIRLHTGSSLPEPFETLLAARGSRLMYIGKATSLNSRMLRNELRGRGHGTFFRSIGAVLGFRPLAGSLTEKVNKQNYSFAKPDRDSIVAWISANLEVSWRELSLDEVRPLLNLDGNPLALVELDELRVLCRRIATTAVGMLQK